MRFKNFDYVSSPFCSCPWLCEFDSLAFSYVLLFFFKSYYCFVILYEPTDCVIFLFIFFWMALLTLGGNRPIDHCCQNVASKCEYQLFMFKWFVFCVIYLIVLLCLFRSHWIKKKYMILSAFGKLEWVYVVVCWIQVSMIHIMYT